jgi:hypothetical protein
VRDQLAWLGAKSIVDVNPSELDSSGERIGVTKPGGIVAK